MSKKETTFGDSHLCMKTAAQFLKVGGNFFSNLPNTQEGVTSFLQNEEQLGALIVAATNLVFSIELYLKAIAVLNNGRHIHSHKLTELFNDLNASRRGKIETSYREQTKPEKGMPLLKITFSISPQPFSDEDKSAVTLRGPLFAYDGVGSLLKFEDVSFEKWRYLYSQAKPDKLFTVHFHYCHLCGFVNSLQDQLDETYRFPRYDSRFRLIAASKS